MAATFQEYYKILGVERNATDKEIKAAYRKLARKWHPDLHPSEEKKEAEAQFKRVNEAYEVLSDPEKRAKYDRLGKNWRDGQDFTYEQQPGMGGVHFYTSGDFGEGVGGGFSEFFERFFGGRTAGFTGARSGSRPVRGQDIESKIELTLEEAYRGVTKALRVTGGSACTTCGGTGVTGRSFCTHCGGTGTVPQEKTLEVKIPAGVQEGSRIRLKGQGGESLGGAERGDLYLKVSLLPHPLFRLQGSNIEVDAVVRPEQAALGDKITVQTLDGPVTMTVPPGSRAGVKLRLREKGFPVKGAGRGHQYVRLVIDIPARLSDEEKELYRKLEAIGKGGKGRS